MSPTNSTPKDISAMSRAEKLAKLKALKAAKANRPRPVPLSFAQRGFWLQGKLSESGGYAQLVYGVCLSGSLDVNAVEATFNQIIARHETLRSTFAEKDGEAYQWVHPAKHLNIRLIDMTHIDKTDQYENDLMAFEEKRILDLSQWPLLSVTLLRKASNQHVLILAIHHIISDAWSLDLMMKEFMSLYTARLTGQNTSLKPLAIQYRDYVAWQQKTFTQERMDSLLTYWKDRLKGVPALLNLPTDNPRPSTYVPATAEHKFRIPSDIYLKLKTLAHGENASLFMVLIAGFQLLLARHANQADVVVGTPVSERNQANLEQLIGLLVNTIAIRTHVSSKKSFRDLIKNTRTLILTDFRHKDLPFEILLKNLPQHRDPSHAPVYQSMFSLLQRGPTPSLEGLSFQALKPDRSSSPFDLHLLMFSNEDYLEATLEYNTSLFNPSTAKAMAHRLCLLLEEAAKTPDLPSGMLSILQEDERQCILNQLTGPTPPLTHRPLHQRIARYDSSAIAVIDDLTHLTYGELNQRANHLAHQLASRNVTADTLVGIGISRGINMVVAVLAIHRVGACCVPIDPNAPELRIKRILQHLPLALVLTDHTSQAQLDVTCENINLDHFSSNPQNPEKMPLDKSTPQNLAYVIHTSGSTGVPKSVALTQSTLSNLVDWHAQQEDAVPPVTLQFASLSFDVSFQEIYTTWCAGGTLVLPSAEDRLDPSRQLNLIQRHRISRLFLPVVAFQQLFEYLERENIRPDSLKTIITAGEQLRITPAVRSWFAGGSCRLHNHYGPSETHVVSALSLGTDSHTWPDLPSIGTPLDGCKTLILDPFMSPVPQGVHGELMLAGTQVARGYLGRPALTAERFVPDPLSSEPGSRLYRTGDMARLDAEGCIQFIGRMDFQIKIRGFRVELGEIEAAILENPMIADATVISHTDGSGHRQLAGYVTAASPQLAENNLFSDLRNKLPGYMVPASLMILESMPVTANGKIDRTKLPKPLTTTNRESRKPENSLQQRLFECFSEILGLADFGIDDDFFEIGGHSLSATRLAFLISDTMAYPLNTRDIFENPSVATLASRVQTQPQGQNLPKIVTVSRNEPIPLSYAQRRLWFMDHMHPGSSFYNIPMAVQLNGPLDCAALSQAFKALVNHHEAFRTRFTGDIKQPNQVIEQGSFDSINTIDISANPQALQSLLDQENTRGFKLDQIPLFRVYLWRLSEQKHVLQLTMHHIITDGWSMTILVADLVAVYNALMANKTNPLPGQSLHYADYANWQSNWMTSAAMADRIEFWQDKLADAPALTTLPTDRPRPEIMKHRGDILPFQMAADKLQGLRELARREKSTLFMVLLTGFMALLRFYVGRDDLVIGTDTANRDRPETRNMVGFFINQLVLRFNIDPKQSMHDLLQQVREDATASYAHQDVPFDMLVESLNPKRSSAYTPFYQVKLVYQDQPEYQQQPLGLDLEQISMERGTSQFDLVLNLRDSQNGLLGTAEYNSDLFDQSTISTFLNRLAWVWQHWAVNQQLSIEDLNTQLEEKQRAEETAKAQKSREEDRGKLGQFMRSSRRRRKK